MLKIDKSKSSGNTVLYLVIGVIVIVIIGVVIFKIVKKSPAEQPEQPQSVEPVKEKMPEPIYEIIVGNVKFNFTEVEDMGNILECEEMITPPMVCLPQQKLTTTDKFIKVKITAQNIGKDNLPAGSWRVEEVFDNEGRKFYSQVGAISWIPSESQCSYLLKPYFEPTSCIKIYEVSKHSVGLKIKVFAPPADPKKIEPGKEYFVDINLYNEKYCWDDSDCACGINKYTKDCFLGNKTYIDFSGSPTYSADYIEKCNKFCATTAEEPTIRCINNECK